MLECSELIGLLDARRFCERSPFGTKIVTQCLYPSASPVYVHIARGARDDFRVSDGGGAAHVALAHGRDSWSVDAGLRAARDLFSLELQNEELVANAPTREWLPNVVAAVANGAVHAANVAITHNHQSKQKTLKQEIGERLIKTVPDRFLASDYEYRGRSGKVWGLDFAILLPNPILIKAVTPHHNSIASTYTMLSDTMSEGNRRLSVFARRPLDEDAALLRQVSEMVPLRSVLGMTQSLFL